MKWNLQTWARIAAIVAALPIAGGILAWLWGSLLAMDTETFLRLMFFAVLFGLAILAVLLWVMSRIAGRLEEVRSSVGNEHAGLVHSVNQVKGGALTGLERRMSKVEAAVDKLELGRGEIERLTGLTGGLASEMNKSQKILSTFVDQVHRRFELIEGAPPVKPFVKGKS